MRTCVLLGLLACGAFSAAKHSIEWEAGTVLWQNTGVAPVGGYAISSTDLSANASSIGPWTTVSGSAETVTRTRPIYGAWNIVEFETGPYRYRLEEVDRRALAGLAALVNPGVGPASRLILTVHSEVPFFREKDLLVMLDTRGRKHYFQIVGAELVD